MAPRKGTTNNPAGRPPKSRALTAILERAGNVKVTVEGTDTATARKQLLATYLWDAVLTGHLPFEVPVGDEGLLVPARLPAKEWVALVHFLYAHIDGPPKAALELSTDPARPLVVQRRPDLAGLSDEDLAALESILAKTTDPG